MAEIGGEWRVEEGRKILTKVSHREKSATAFKYTKSRAKLWKIIPWHHFPVGERGISKTDAFWKEANKNPRQSGHS
jgi:hypothetical protein